MKNNRTTILVFTLLILASALYRVWDNRPLGFAPQIAMALFAGSIIQNKKFAFVVPILSMLISDCIYQLLYVQGLTELKGFYHGQLINYILFACVTVIGFYINKNNILAILGGSIAGVIFFYVASNFADWVGGGLDLSGHPYPKTFSGLLSCFEAGLPFLKGSLWATLLFSGLFFGVYHLFTRNALSVRQRVH